MTEHSPYVGHAPLSNGNGHVPPVSIIDLRSDTVTKPTAAMRAAMAEAEVGDDVYGDDPSILRLQNLAVELTGKAAALFVPSGTMGNLISVLTHCQNRGDEFIVGDQAHIHCYEQGGSASLGGVHSKPLSTCADGTIPLELIIAAIRPGADDHSTVTRLICLENTHNRCGGRALSKSYIDSVGMIAKAHNLKLHIDGARIFNASVVLGIPVKEILEVADSASFCLSKGLASPVGSLIVGSVEFIKQAKRLRKALGGGMRQAGILAAAGIVSLTTMIDRLSIDHSNAKLLAIGLSEIPGLLINPSEIETNIVYVKVVPEFPIPVSELKEKLKQHGILMGVTAADQIRFVLHYMITSEHIQTVLQQINTIIKQSKNQT